MQRVAFSLHMAARGNSGLKGWEYPPNSGITIKEIINTTNGKAFGGSFLVVVPAKLTGTTRKRVQFSDKAKAREFAEKQYGGSKEEGKSFYSISDSERRQILYSLPRLREAGITITEAVEHALKTLNPEGGHITVDKIAKELIDSKRNRYERESIRFRSYKDFKNRGNAFADEFEGTLATEFQMTGHTELKQWLVEMEVAPRTAKNYLNTVAEILKYAIQKRYMVYNPLSYLTDADRKEICGDDLTKEPNILTVDEAKSLISTAYETDGELNMLAAITLALFCGIRTEEVKRLAWDSVNLDEGIVTIGADIAKKRRIRHVTISDNAKKWLALASKKTATVADDRHASHYWRRFKKLRLTAGFETWHCNAMRHSFGSYHYALHGDSLATSRELGHKSNDYVLFDHYRALAKASDGKNYFSIEP